MFKYLKNDLPVSIVVFLVALPLFLCSALASGAPLFSGLIAGIVGGSPITQIIVRSSANLQLGERTKMTLAERVAFLTKEHF